VGFRTDRDEVLEIRFDPVESFVRSFVLERSSWAAVLEICDGTVGTHEFRPKFLGEARFCQDRSNSFADNPVCSLRDAVLLGCVGRCFRLVLDAQLPAQFCHLFAVLRSAVRSNRFDASPVLLEYVPKVRKASRTSFAVFCLRGYRYVMRTTSSINVAKYLASPTG
jgi:hypothetical protein